MAGTALTAPRRTLEDHLHDRGAKREDLPAVDFAGDGAPLFPCRCGRLCRTFELIYVRDVAELPGDYACSHCLTDSDREKTAKREKENKKDPPPWGDNDESNELRIRRNNLVNENLWTVGPGSPLEQASQLEFAAWIEALHAMTVSSAGPRSWTFPPRPQERYKPLSKPHPPKK